MIGLISSNVASLTYLTASIAAATAASSAVGPSCKALFLRSCYFFHSSPTFPKQN